MTFNLVVDGCTLSINKIQTKRYFQKEDIHYLLARAKNTTYTNVKML